MPASKFKFVSPGVKIAEIDNSQLPALPGIVGPVIIGRAAKGPGLRPVQVNSMSDFVNIFGAPLAGNAAGDAWRAGPHGLAPTYGAYAAQAWFRNSSPVTFVRLLGRANDDAGTTKAAGAAGWKIGTTIDVNGEGGAFGLLVVPSASVTGAESTGTLAAIFYCEKGVMELSGTGPGGSSVAGTTAWVKCDDSYNIKIRHVVSGSATGSATGSYSEAAASDEFTANFIRSSKNFIRKSANTNPTYVNSLLYDASSLKKYFLGESYEGMFDTHITADTTYYAAIVGLTSGSDINQNVQLRTLTRARTAWTISQTMGGPTSSYVAADQQKLFRFVTHDAGLWEAQNLKISISDILGPTNEFEEYGSFTVEIRMADDIDEAPSPVEVFTLCNLNPNSPNYVGKRIGDSYVDWDEGERRYRDYGNYANQSRYVRVELNSDVDAGDTNPSFLPFGFFGPVRWVGFMSTSGSTSSYTIGSTASTVNTLLKAEDEIYHWFSASNRGLIYTDTVDMSSSIYYPSIPQRISSSEGSLSSPKDAYFGISTGRPGNSTRFDESYGDLVRAFPSAVGNADGDASSAGMEYSFVFSLDDVALTGTNAYWQSGSYAGGTSANAVSSSYTEILEQEFDKFTMPLIGGFDGVDIEEKDPFNNTRALATGKTELTSYALNSAKMAVDTCADPEKIECNMMSMPGIISSQVQDHLIGTCERRADCFTVLDLDGDYTPAFEVMNDQTEQQRKGDVTTTINNLTARAINTSYACSYYPWVQIRDPQSGRNLWVPPSVPAIGTIASSAAQSEVWFAPAGFTRGGLTEGAAGLSVTGVKQKLISKERDKLYAANINPIASFPAEGIVIFGQKTLQVTPSALDRINVRRLLIYVKREISFIASRLLFEQNVQGTWDRFTSQVVPFLDSIVARLGLTDYKVILDETTTTPDLIDRNIMYAKIYLKPARSIEFIAIDFIITRTGASFED